MHENIHVRTAASAAGRLLSALQLLGLVLKAGRGSAQRNELNERMCKTDFSSSVELHACMKITHE
jgi:hypothetical protein